MFIWLGTAWQPFHMYFYIPSPLLPYLFPPPGLEGASIKGIRRAWETTSLQASRHQYTLTLEFPASRNDSSLIFSTMSLRPNATSSCPSASLLRVLQGLLLLSLLLTTLVPWTAGESKRNSGKTEGGVSAALEQCLGESLPWFSWGWRRSLH